MKNTWLGYDVVYCELDSIPESEQRRCANLRARGRRGDHRRFRARRCSFAEIAGPRIEASRSRTLPRLVSAAIVTLVQIAHSKHTLNHIQWSNHPYKIRVNPDEPLAPTAAADVPKVGGAARAAQGPKMRRRYLHRTRPQHPRQTEKKKSPILFPRTQKISLHKHKRMFSPTTTRPVKMSRICAGYVPNRSNITPSRTATTGRAMSVRCACGLCTKSWTAHSARCALRLARLWGFLTNARKEPQPTVVFTLSPDAPFSSYTPESIPFKDEKLALSFEMEEIMHESMLLLRFNCPDSSCEYMATGWSDLKLHVRGIHKKFMWCVPLFPCSYSRRLNPKTK
jgi:hypothetical protein